MGVKCLKVCFAERRRKRWVAKLSVEGVACKKLERMQGISVIWVRCERKVRMSVFKYGRSRLDDVWVVIT